MPDRARQNRGRQTRTLILEAALGQFSQRGFEAVGLRDIADAVGVNHGLIRYHFGNKETLWRESAAFMFERLRTELDLDALPSELTARDRLERFARNYVHYCSRHPEHARFMVQESNRDSERMRWLVENLVKPAHARLLPLIEALIEQGDLPAIEPVQAIYLMSAMAQAPYLLRAELRYAYSIDALDDEAVAEHADAVVKFIFGTRAPA